jgi:outer membrane protein assembly factor BamB
LWHSGLVWQNIIEGDLTKKHACPPSEMAAGVKEGGAMKRLWAVTGFLAIIITSCPLFWGDNKPGTEPVYNSRVAWKAEIVGWGSRANTLYTGGHAYVQEGSFFMSIDSYPGAPFCRVVKVRLSDGEIIWKTGTLTGLDETDNPIKMEDKLFLPVSKAGLLFVYDDGTGQLLATVKLGTSDYEAKNNGMWSPYPARSGLYIFWGKSLDGGGGLMRFDTRRIDYSRESHEEQIIEPERVFEDPEISNAIMNIIAEDGIVYFLTANGSYNFNEGFAILGAMDAETTGIIWSKKLPQINGHIPHALVINGDYLHIIDKAPSCYLKATGKAVYEFDDRNRDPNKDYYLSGSAILAGVSIYDNKLYYCTDMAERLISLLGLGESIICLDAATGKQVWGDMVSGGVSLDTFPVIINGKAFVLTDQGLRVYDAQTGKLLGVDKNIWNRGDTANYGYEGMFIGFDMDHQPGISHLIAIRAD